MVRTTPKIRRMSEGVWDMISAILRSESVREGATTRLTLARDASSNDASRQAAQRVESSNRRPFAKLRWSTARNGTSLSYAPRHRSSVVELSIRNRAVVGSNPTGGSVSPAPLLAVLGPPCPAPVPVALPWHPSGCRAATPRRSRAPISLLLLAQPTTLRRSVRGGNPVVHVEKRTQRSVITTGGLTSGRQTTHRPASCSAMLDQVHVRVDAGRGSSEREMTRKRAGPRDARRRQSLPGRRRTGRASTTARMGACAMRQPFGSGVQEPPAGFPRRVSAALTRAEELGTLELVTTTASTKRLSGGS